MLRLLLLSFAIARADDPPAASTESTPAPVPVEAPPVAAPPVDSTAAGAPATEAPLSAPQAIAAGPDYRAAESAYMKALAAWRRSDYDIALGESRAALAIDGQMEEARLLEAYALLRLRQIDEGVAKLDVLASGEDGDVVSDEVARRASTLSKRITERWRRDQLSLALGNVFQIEGAYQGVTLDAGPSLDVEFPVWNRFSARAELVVEWMTGNQILSFGGPTGGALVVAHQPIGRGTWSADLGVGPTVWYARGGYWEDGSQFYLGVRAAVGLDVRLARRFGLRTEAGTRYFPAVADTIPWYSQPLDTRLSVVWWLGK